MAGIFLSLLLTSCGSSKEKLHSLILKDSTVMSERKMYADSLDKKLQETELQLLTPAVYKDSIALKKVKSKSDKLFEIRKLQKELLKYLDDVKWQILKYSNTVTIKIEGKSPELSGMSKNKKPEELMRLFEGEGPWSSREILLKMKKLKSKLEEICGEERKADFEKLSADYLKGSESEEWQQNFTKNSAEIFLFLTELQKDACVLCYRAGSALSPRN
jgi:hypothetical protein